MESGETRHQNTTQSIAVVQGRDGKGINEGGMAYWKDFEKQRKGGMNLRNSRLQEAARGRGDCHGDKKEMVREAEGEANCCLRIQRGRKC